MLPKQSFTKAFSFIPLNAIGVTILFKSYFGNEVKTELSGKGCKIPVQVGTTPQPGMLLLWLRDRPHWKQLSKYKQIRAHTLNHRPTPQLRISSDWIQF